MSNIAEKFGVGEKIDLFFIGDNFYSKSQTMMSSIYIAGSYERFDWGFVNCLLREGKSVYIRPATHEELDWAHKKIGQFLVQDRD